MDHSTLPSSVSQNSPPPVAPKRRRETDAAKAERFRLEAVRLGREDARLRAEEERLAIVRRALDMDGIFCINGGTTAQGMIAFVDVSLRVLAANALDGSETFEAMQGEEQAQYLYTLSSLLCRARRAMVPAFTMPKDGDR